MAVEDLIVSLTLTRTELSLGDLLVTPANDYFVVREGIGEGAIQYRRVTAQSPFVAGRVPVHIVPDIIILNPIIRVRGTSYADLDTKIDTLTVAFTQFIYTLTFEIGGEFDREYQCEAADYATGNAGQYEDLKLRSFVQDVAFEVPAVLTTNLV
jgi:hypothetical protein